MYLMYEVQDEITSQRSRRRIQAGGQPDPRKVSREV
jgi:hypothetical protein